VTDQPTNQPPGISAAPPPPPPPPGTGYPGAGAVGPGYPPPGQPYGYPYPYPPYAYAPQPSTNTMAILALVFAFLFAPLGLAFGIVGLKQIKRTGEAGHGLALAGLICGAVFTAIYVVYIVVIIVFLSAVSMSGPPNSFPATALLSLLMNR
jgi:hypothetical protein